jgi:hypothetical protein
MELRFLNQHEDRGCVGVRRIFGPKKAEITGERGTFHSEGLRKYTDCSPDVGNVLGRSYEDGRVSGHVVRVEVRIHTYDARKT